MVTRKCRWCKRPFQAKEADVKRGWARCCSKSCAASLREKVLDRGRPWENDEDYQGDQPHPFSVEALGQDDSF